MLFPNIFETNILEIFRKRVWNMLLPNIFVKNIFEIYISAELLNQDGKSIYFKYV